MLSVVSSLPTDIKTSITVRYFMALLEYEYFTLFHVKVYHVGFSVGKTPFYAIRGIEQHFTYIQLCTS